MDAIEAEFEERLKTTRRVAWIALLLGFSLGVGVGAGIAVLSNKKEAIECTTPSTAYISELDAVG